MSAAPQIFLDGRVTLHAGDCLAVLDDLPTNSVEAVITDPPYHYDTIVKRFGGANAAEAQFGLDGAFKRASAGFMGKSWDGGDVAFNPATWAKVMRVLKPGGMLAAFSAPKCYHKMAFAIEAAGFEMRDRIVHLYDLTEREAAFLESLSLALQDALFRIIAAGDPLGDLFWCFGSGFPKGLNISKAIDKHLGAKREKVRREATSRIGSVNTVGGDIRGASRPWIEAAKERGFHEVDGPEAATSEAATSEAATWDGWDVALKPAYEPIALARKPLSEKSVAAQVLKTGTGGININGTRVGTRVGTRTASTGVVVSENQAMSGGNYGREPTGEVTIGNWPADLTHDGSAIAVDAFPVSKEGSAARYFYTAKADGDDRLGSGHPTVKPVDLMRWLCRLLTPPGGIILDPFSGTGTTGEAAFREGFSAVLIEREEEYRADIARRMGLVLSGRESRRAAGAKAKAARRNEEPDLGPLFGGSDVGGAPDLRPLRRPGREIGPTGLRR
ncbi:MAG: DNA methyltransferase [Rhizobiaceae bacterium]